MATPDRCPDDLALERFAAGELDAATRDRVETHATHCATCNGWLRDALADEELLAGVRRMLPQGSAPPEVPGYRVLHEIGSGGMGVVFAAEQLHPRRMVALKLIRAGIHSRDGLQRFQREIAALARLQHRGIAQIHAAGAFPAAGSTQPFLAMELVCGRPLLAHARSLPRRAQLALFGEICAAVQHAHQKGVIHRDLKPPNILVDEAGQPKVLDFGIARIAAGTSTDDAPTIDGQLLGTVPYLGPEQLCGDPRDIDVRADVHALGVLLYEMLTGTLPYAIAGKPLGEQLRVVVETAPRPLGDVDRTLRGDLTTIVMKALAKEREQRYAAAAELARDIERFLRHEPIAARPPGRVYLLRKFARRHRVGVAAAGALLGAVVATTVITWRAERETRAMLAEAEGARDFLQEVLIQSSPEQNGGDTPTLAHALELALQRVDTHLREQPRVRAAVEHTLGRVLGGLGRLDDAEQHLRTALRLFEQEYGARDRKILYALLHLAQIRMRQGELDDADRMIQRALGMRDLLEPEHAMLLAEAWNTLAAAEYRRGRLADSERAMRAAIAALQDVESDELREANSPIYDGVLAVILSARGSVQEADLLFCRAAQQLRQRSGAKNLFLANTLGNHAHLLVGQQRFAQAEPLVREALAIELARLSPEDERIAAKRRTLGAVLFGLGQQEAGLAETRAALASLQQRFGEHPGVVQTLVQLAGQLAESGSRDEAERSWRQAFEMGTRKLGPDHLLTLRAEAGLGRSLLDRDPAAARPLLEHALSVYQRDHAGLEREIAALLRALSSRG